ncbi:phage tail protein I [Albidovulum sp.]|uniref:phage tail protein I n=1 Tax=Albidovulum sp. TaxID=1872424 RepID=UPI0039B8FC65
MSLLPPTSTPVETALEIATERAGSVAVPVGDLWNPATCPPAMLPWLAWALSVDGWNAEWTEAEKRAAIAASIGIHRRKGTVAAILAGMETAGIADGRLFERWTASRHDGAFNADGSRTHAPSDHWAEYRIEIDRPISIAQAAEVRRLLGKVAPARCHLKAMTYPQAQNLYDAAIAYDGVFSHGVA